MIYSASAAAGQPTDFFIIRLTADINTAGCHEFYASQNDHNDRMAAYWLEQVNMSAAVPGLSFDNFNIPASYYAPVAVNPSTTVTTGITWSAGGTGMAGYMGGPPRARPSTEECRIPTREPLITRPSKQR